MLGVDSYYSHIKTSMIAKEFESNPFSPIAQYFPKNHYVLSDYLWLDLGIVYAGSFILYFLVWAMLRRSKYNK
ncbi:hypothetical protein EV294_11361 [Paenibacillus sp. BK033]|nr:hypothetical protein [Paenibacillus sp. BK720]TCM89120.1 hypothetical protein EV294_11361 [Paenibacillus sp. BK033]